MTCTLVIQRFRTFVIPLLAAAVVLGCEPKTETARVAPVDAKPVSGGTLVFAFDGAAVTAFGLDPHRSSFAPHHRVIRSIFDSLVVLRPGHEFGPWLAKSWDISADGLTYTFHLRDDVTFHDGSHFDAAAVKFNLDRIADPKNALVAANDIGTYESSEAIDPATLRVRLSAPFSPLLANLSKSSLGMVSPAAVRKYGADIGTHPVGTGPFRFISLQAGTEIALDRNPDYHWPAEGAPNRGPAYLEHLIFKNVPEEATRVAVLQNGQAGAADIIPPQNLLALRKDPSYSFVQGELLNHNYALYPNLQREPWTDLRMRQAFRLSLDIDAAVKTVQLGTLPRAWSPLSPGMFGFDKRFDSSWKPDRAQAAKLLDELGWKLPAGAKAGAIREKDGKRLTIDFLETQGNREKRLDLITVFKRQLADVGFDLRIESVATGNYLERIAAGRFDLLGGSLFAPDADVLRSIHSPHVRSRSGISSVRDPELTSLLERASQAQGDAQRLALYSQAQQRILDQVDSIPIYVLTYFIAARNGVEGVAIDTHGFPQFQGAWIQ